MNILRKYKWHIIGYIIYVTIVLRLEETEYHWSSNEFWVLCLIWCVTIPLVGYTILYALRKVFFTSKQSGKAEYPAKVGFEMSIPLVDFAKEHGAMKICKHTDSLTGQTKIKECVFTATDGTETYVWVANNIKDYSAEDISKNKDNLYVMMMPSGEYCLCIPWEDVEL